MAAVSHAGLQGVAAGPDRQDRVGRRIPDVDVRVVPLTVAGGRLRVALTGQEPDQSLPCGEPRPDGPLDAQARRIVRAAIGLDERYLEQLYTLSVGDDPHWRVIVSYLALFDAADAATATGKAVWFDTAAVPAVGSDDRMVLDYAIVRLRAKIGYSTIAFHLLPPTFTLRELQTAYEAILDRTLDKRNFRRRVVAAELLEPTGEKRRDGSHRPALLYRFRADHDPATYLTPSWNIDHAGADAPEVRGAWES
jgi:8-oxo-dGTP diphosphatase